MQAPERHLVLGGARSGKTRHALQLAEALANRQSESMQSGSRQTGSVVYVATAQAGDAEMAERITRHRAERPASWRTLEAPDHLAAALSSLQPGTVAVIDCLTLWLSNAMLRDFNEQAPRSDLATWCTERDAMLRCLQHCPASIIMVSNEVGSGIVPMSALSRRFQDEQGWLNQTIAAASDRVTLVVAGIAIAIKAPGSGV